MVLADNACHHTVKSPRIPVDYVIVTKRFYGSISDITRSYSTSTVILSGDIYYDRIPALIAQCKALKLHYHLLSGEGAIFRTSR